MRALNAATYAARLWFCEINQLQLQAANEAEDQVRQNNRQNKVRVL